MYACLFQPVRDASACGLASAASEPARDSLEPLRSAPALSNRAGGGAPAHIEKSGAPRGLKDDRACGLASAASEPARDSLEPLRSAPALSNRAGGGAPAHIEKSGAPRGLKD